MSQNDRDYSEKRDFIRMRVETAVMLQHAGQEFAAACLDLSSTGMHVEAATALNMGDRVRVLIPSSHSELKGLDAEAEVIRVSPLEGGGQALGLAIVSMI
ncbi:PilZ domain-containing protein [Pseudomonas cavernae]|uniref:PilZ domain-containing protein n=1 Tax=Pseudomonas cavernae TaxID=2320867 RepID=A0A385Z686_9PSED|nr:PilZ domain-containing protein [Pseudomonas cavernae]AYC33158.1 PilZ domain-containing protein [Pseudomonas cavernae]